MYNTNKTQISKIQFYDNADKTVTDIESVWSNNYDDSFDDITPDLVKNLSLPKLAKNVSSFKTSYKFDENEDMNYSKSVL